MVSDQEIASCVESLLRGSVGAGEAASLAAVLQRVQAQLGVDLSHKAPYIRDQMDLFFGPRLQPPPPTTKSQQQQAQNPPPLPASSMPQQQQQVQLQVPFEMQQQFAAMQPQYVFQAMPQQLPPVVSGAAATNAANAAVVSAPPQPVPAMAFYPPPPLAFRYANALGGVATGGTLSFQQPAPGVAGMASPTAAPPAAAADNKERIDGLYSGACPGAMKILVWNCRGMRKTSAIRALQVLLERLRPDLVFLSESHLSKAKAGNLKRRFCFDEMVCHENDGRSGGLLMMWHSDLNVTSREIHSNYIDIRVDEHSDQGWRFTGFYGEPSGDRKHLTWDYIRELSGRNNLPWFIRGNFNEILFGNEKEGGNIRPQRCMQAFRDTINDCDLDDLGYIGDLFTWRRGKIRERLDSVLGNNAIMLMFPSVGVVHEDFDKSDHRTILIDIEHSENSSYNRGSVPKRFEARWLCEENVETIVQEAWDRANFLPGASLAKKTGIIRDSLHEWDNNVLKGPRSKLRELQKELNDVMTGPMSDDALTK